VTPGYTLPSEAVEVVCSQVSKCESTTVLDIEMIAQPEKSIARSEVFLFTTKN